MIRALIFDCFGVLYTDSVLAYMRDPRTPPKNAQAMHELDEQAALGIVTKKEFVQQVATLLNCPVTEIEQRFFRGLQRNDELIDYMHSLRKDSHTPFKAGLLSNIGSDMMDGCFTSTELDQLFDAVVLSGAVRLAKPDPAIYKLMCDRLDVLPTEAIMIDDNPRNVAGAQKLGMQGILYNNFVQFKAELEILI